MYQTMTVIMITSSIFHNHFIICNLNKMEGKLKLTSFNCNGFKDRNYDYIRDILISVVFYSYRRLGYMNLSINKFVNYSLNANIMLCQPWMSQKLGRLVALLAAVLLYGIKTLNYLLFQFKLSLNDCVH